MDNQTSLSRAERAEIIAQNGGIEAALIQGKLSRTIDATLSEILVLGLLRQGVRKYIGIFGHGSTDVAEVLRVYEQAGVLKTFAVRHETAATHAATALRWVTGEKCAVITSIGPGALHALAGSLAPQSDGLGVWFLLGDETTEDEGPNMQQITGNRQGQFLQLFSSMGQTYKLHTPNAVGTALRRGLAATDHPYRQGPFFLLMPMNTQPQLIQDFNLDELPQSSRMELGAAADTGDYEKAAHAIHQAEKVMIKIGGGAKRARDELLELLELTDGVSVCSPMVTGLIPFSHPRNMTVGGSKGSLSGNFAMEEAGLLIAIGTRAVCQSDCSRTGYPNVQQVININGDVDSAVHYGKTIPLIGDIKATLVELNQHLDQPTKIDLGQPSTWLAACMARRQEWDAFRQARYESPCLFDEMWGEEVLTQPAAIKIASDWAQANNTIKFFDAGDVQANGFQIVEDEEPGKTFTETGASYMGFAVSALMATALSEKQFYGLAFSGDGSFVMNPQILIDGVEHGVTGCILLLDNRRMAAISGLQNAQYQSDYATNDRVEVDYLSWARAIKGVAAFDGGLTPDTLNEALNQAKQHSGLSLIHVKVYYGDHPLGGMGVFGRWNVGNWCEETQTLRHKIGL